MRCMNLHFLLLWEQILLCNNIYIYKKTRSTQTRLGTSFAYGSRDTKIMTELFFSLKYSIKSFLPREIVSRNGIHGVTRYELQWCTIVQLLNNFLFFARCNFLFCHFQTSHESCKKAVWHAWSPVAIHTVCTDLHAIRAVGNKLANLLVHWYRESMWTKVILSGSWWHHASHHA